MAGMTVARFGVPQEKNRVVYLKIFGKVVSDEREKEHNNIPLKYL
jgi:hypothetical protein